MLSSVIDADAGLALTFPLLSFHHAFTVFFPSPFDSAKLFDDAVATNAVQVLASLRQTCVAVPDDTASVAVTVAVFV